MFNVYERDVIAINSTHLVDVLKGVEDVIRQARQEVHDEPALEVVAMVDLSQAVDEVPRLLQLQDLPDQALVRIFCGVQALEVVGIIAQNLHIPWSCGGFRRRLTTAYSWADATTGS